MLDAVRIVEYLLTYLIERRCLRVLDFLLTLRQHLQRLDGQVLPCIVRGLLVIFLGDVGQVGGRNRHQRSDEKSDDRLGQRPRQLANRRFKLRIYGGSSVMCMLIHFLSPALSVSREWRCWNIGRIIGNPFSDAPIIQVGIQVQRVSLRITSVASGRCWIGSDGGTA